MILKVFLGPTNIQQGAYQRGQTNDGRDPTIEQIDNADLSVALPLAQIEVVPMHMLRCDIGEAAFPQFAHHHSLALEIAEIEWDVMEFFTAIVVLLGQGS